LLAAGVIVDVWLGCKVIYSFVYGIYSFVCSSVFFVYSLMFSCCFWCCIACMGFVITSCYFGWMNTFPQCIMSLAFVSFLKGDTSSFLYDSGWPIFGIAALGGFISYSICLISLLGLSLLVTFLIDLTTSYFVDRVSCNSSKGYSVKTLLRMLFQVLVIISLTSLCSTIESVTTVESSCPSICPALLGEEFMNHQICPALSHPLLCLEQRSIDPEKVFKIYKLVDEMHDDKSVSYGAWLCNLFFDQTRLTSPYCPYLQMLYNFLCLGVLWGWFEFLCFIGLMESPIEDDYDSPQDDEPPDKNHMKDLGKNTRVWLTLEINMETRTSEMKWQKRKNRKSTEDEAVPWWKFWHKPVVEVVKTLFDCECQFLVETRTKIRAVVVAKQDDDSYLVRLPNGEIQVASIDMLSYTSKSRRNAKRRKRAKVAKAKSKLIGFITKLYHQPITAPQRRANPTRSARKAARRRARYDAKTKERRTQSKARHEARRARSKTQRDARRRARQDARQDVFQSKVVQETQENHFGREFKSVVTTIFVVLALYFHVELVSYCLGLVGKYCIEPSVIFVGSYIAPFLFFACKVIIVLVSMVGNVAVSHGVVPIGRLACEFYTRNALYFNFFTYGGAVAAFVVYKHSKPKTAPMYCLECQSPSAPALPQEQTLAVVEEVRQDEPMLVAEDEPMLAKEDKPKYINVKLPDGSNQSIEYDPSKKVADIKTEVLACLDEGLCLNDFNLDVVGYWSLDRVSRTLGDYGITAGSSLVVRLNGYDGLLGGNNTQPDRDDAVSALLGMGRQATLTRQTPLVATNQPVQPVNTAVTNRPSHHSHNGQTPHQVATFQAPPIPTTTNQHHIGQMTSQQATISGGPTPHQPIPVTWQPNQSQWQAAPYGGVAYYPYPSPATHPTAWQQTQQSVANAQMGFTHQGYQQRQHTYTSLHVPHQCNLS